MALEELIEQFIQPALPLLLPLPMGGNMVGYLVVIMIMVMMTLEAGVRPRDRPIKRRRCIEKWRIYCFFFIKVVLVVVESLLNSFDRVHAEGILYSL